MTLGTRTILEADARWTWEVSRRPTASFLPRASRSPVPFERAHVCLIYLSLRPVYPLGAIRYLAGADKTAVEITNAHAEPIPSDPKRVDRGMHVSYALPDSITAESYVDFSMPGWGPFGLLPRMPKLSAIVKLEGGEIEYYNYPLAGSYHYIKVKPKKGSGRTERAYKHPDGSGEAWWTS